MQTEKKKSAPPYGRVELVPSGRGGTKAKYRGRTFTRSRSNGTRYHWHCDVRACPSLLTTDVFGKEHVVFSAKPHDEEVHRRAESSKRKRRSEATFKQGPSKRIKDYDYVKENEAEGTQYWRCKFVKCSGRCRTDVNGRVVLGPSPHSAEVHGTQPTAPEDVGTSAVAEPGHLVGQEHDIRETTEGTSRKALPVQNQEKMEERYDQKKHIREQAVGEQRKEEEGETIKPSIVVGLVKPIIKSEHSSKPKGQPMPSYPPAAADTDGLGHVAASCHGDRHATTGQDDSGKLVADATGATARCSSNMNRAAAVLNHESSDATVDHVECIDITSSEGDDMDDGEDNVSHSSVGSECGDAGEEDKSSQLDADYEDKDVVRANDDRSYKTADDVVCGRSQMESGGHQRRRENVLALTRDSPELELRAGVLVQMRRLLEAETQLANKRCQVEILRERILERQLKNLVSLGLRSQPEN